MSKVNPHAPAPDTHGPGPPFAQPTALVNRLWPSRSLRHPPIPLLVTASLAGLLGIAGLLSRWQLPLPACGLKQLTGIPCPFCGGTRSMMAAARLDFTAAMTSNPFVMFASLLVLLWFLAWLLDGVLCTRSQEWIQQLFTRPAGLVSLGALILANWIYLFFNLP